MTSRSLKYALTYPYGIAYFKKRGFFYVLLYYLGVRYVLFFFNCSKPHNVFCAAVHTSENLLKKIENKKKWFPFLHSFELC